MERRTATRGLASMLALASATLAAASAADATQPMSHARYVGTVGQVVAAVQVARSGRMLTSAGRGSYVKRNDLAFDPSCARHPYLALLAHGRRARIDGRGGFAFSRRSARLTLRVHGRFLTPYTARLVFRVRPDSGFPCEPGPRAVYLHPARVDPPFDGCRSQRGNTLLQNDVARIFDQRKIVFGYYFRPVAYGCLFSVDRRFELGLDDPDAPTGDADSSDARDFELAGPYTAYVLSYLGAVIGSDVVNVVDLRTGSRLLPTPLVGTPPDVGAPRVVRALVLKENGSAAWIQNSYYSQEEQIWTHDASGYRKLDSAPQRTGPPAITSLQLIGSQLTWQHDGEARSGTLDDESH